MKKGLKSVIALLLAVTTLSTALIGCGKQEAEDKVKETTEGNVETTEGNTSSDKPFEGVTLKYAVSETASQGAEIQELIALVKEETGINIEFTIVPNTKAGEVDKKLVSLMAGDELDILYGATPVLKTFYNAGVLTPLEDLAQNANYDMESKFGSSLPVYDDGQTYGLPAFNDIWLTFYNKKIFDEAGVPYPSADDWTWEKYIETAKKLTDSDKEIYGSFMLDYDNYNYMYATQHGVSHYKEDSTSNYDDPIFKEGLKFYYDLGNVEKIQPTSLEYAAGSYPWNSFVAADNFGMFVCGGWVASMLPNLDKYPRDWEAGILPMPYPEGQEPSTLAVTGNYAIPVTSKNKEAAFAAISFIAENQYKLGYGRVPARIDLTDEEITNYIEENLVPTFVNDTITVEDFKKAWFDPNRKIYSEKVIGTADTTISQIWVEEGQLYGQGVNTDLDKTMETIKRRADEAILDESNE